MISQKTINAIELCTLLARQQNHGCTTTSELAARLGLTSSYLEKIIKPLRQHNLVSAVKGPGGGYQVRGDLSLISMWDIASVFEQTFAVAAKDADLRPDEPAAYELGLEQIVKEALCSFTLADFVDLSSDPGKSCAQEMGRFKFKPLAAPFIPKAPNSVFQLSMAL